MAFGLRALSPRLNLGKMAAIAWFILCCSTGVPAQAIPPTLTAITPPNRIDLTSDQVTVTLTGTGFTDARGLGFDQSNVFNHYSWASISDTSAIVTLTLNDATTDQVVNIWVIGKDGTTSGTLPFNTGIQSTVCLEALQSGECALLWEVAATSATGSSSQSNNSTTPNIVVSLDYQWHAPKNRVQKHFIANQWLAKSADSSTQNFRIWQNPDGKLLYVKVSQSGHEDMLSTTDSVKVAKLLKDAGLSDSPKDHLALHLNFKTGYTQVVTTTMVKPTSGNTCPDGTTTSTGSCTSAVPQQAFVAESSGRFGWNTGVNGQGTFAEFGLSARGSFDYLIPSDKVVQNGNLTYIDLSSANPQNAVGLYEATAHFLLSQVNHGGTTANANIPNTSNLLNFVAGYQNNRGLQNLAANTQTNTRNRYVARFTVNPEINAKNHTKLTVGMEYSGGINGGPHAVQLFFGTNLNPAKLFSGK